METIEVRIAAVREAAEGIRALELEPLHGAPLPSFTAGAHIDLHLPNGLVRSYSLCNAPDHAGHYEVCVNRDGDSRGGSSWLHENAYVGDILTVGVPRNNFELDEAAPNSVFIAGGIGITPLWSMIQRLQALQRPWQLFYAARSRSRAAFMDELEQFDATLRTDSTQEDNHRWGHAHFHMDRQPGQRLDVTAIVRDAPPESHFYCCGPASLLETFKGATHAIPFERIHLEYFASAEQQPAAARAFTVVLAKSGCEVQVPPGTSILDALMDAGVRLDFACREGVCGTCETCVLEGIPDHRDMILSQSERDAGKTMMICCSGSKTARLTLDC